MSDHSDYNDGDGGEDYQNDEENHDDYTEEESEPESELEIEANGEEEGDEVDASPNSRGLISTEKEAKDKHKKGRKDTKPEGKDPKRIPDDQRITTPYMTKYERVRLLAVRATQFSYCALPLIDSQGETDPLLIAIREHQDGKVPLVIRRYHSDGCYEEWKASELIPYIGGLPI